MLIDELKTNNYRYDLSERLRIRQDFAEKMNKTFGTSLKYTCSVIIDYSNTLHKKILDKFLKSSYN